MDNISFVFSKDIEDFDNICPTKLVDDELFIINDYIYITQEIRDSKQFFDVFYFNLYCLRNNFTLYANDRVENLQINLQLDEVIALNALVINLISSAKTFVEYLRAVAKRWFDKDIDKDEFNKYVSNVFDNFFSYRILMNLRDYSQHRSIPISYKDNRYSFDLSQIIDTPDFKFNKKFKEDIDLFLSKFDKNNEYSCLALTITLAEFVVLIIDIYMKFIFYIKDKLFEKYDTIQSMIRLNKSLICRKNKQFKGFVIYEDSDGKCHAFDSKYNPNLFLEQCEKFVKEKYEEEKNAFDYIKEGFYFRG